MIRRLAVAAFRTLPENVQLHIVLLWISESDYAPALVRSIQQQHRSAHRAVLNPETIFREPRR